MGYTHYLYRTVQTFDATLFARFAKDCRAVYARAEIPLANWNGKGKPQFTAKKVAFNGVEQCGHGQRDLGITWPARHATGGVHIASAPVGSWFAGASLDSRTCDGDCSHETFLVEQCYLPHAWETLTPGEPIFSCCKTAYKPYDLLVTACLIILQHYFPGEVTIHSDGESHDWEDARRLCQHVLGYGADFVLQEDDD